MTKRDLEVSIARTKARIVRSADVEERMRLDYDLQSLLSLYDEIPKELQHPGVTNEYVNNVIDMFAWKAARNQRKSA
jgi:hypothetical protein